MTKPTTLNVRVGGALSDFVAANVGEHGAYDKVSEYVRDPIRKDKKEAEERAFEQLKAELGRAFASSDADFRRVTRADDQTKPTPALARMRLVTGVRSGIHPLRTLP
jgi:Arc/MetJ-type ribon-helix-helix transcriptional regulator